MGEVRDGADVIPDGLVIGHRSGGLSSGGAFGRVRAVRGVDNGGAVLRRSCPRSQTAELLDSAQDRSGVGGVIRCLSADPLPAQIPPSTTEVISRRRMSWLMAMAAATMSPPRDRSGDPCDGDLRPVQLGQRGALDGAALRCVDKVDRDVDIAFVDPGEGQRGARGVDLGDGVVDGPVHNVEFVGREAVGDACDAHTQGLAARLGPPDHRLGAGPAREARRMRRGDRNPRPRSGRALSMNSLRPQSGRGGRKRQRKARPALRTGEDKPSRGAAVRAVLACRLVARKIAAGGGWPVDGRGPHPRAAACSPSARTP